MNIYEQRQASVHWRLVRNDAALYSVRNPWWLVLEFYILATCKEISGRVLICDRAYIYYMAA